MYYDNEYRRQRHRERIAEMREQYRQAQPSRRNESQRREPIDIAPMRWIRRRAARRAPAY